MRLIHAAALTCALIAGPVAAQTHDAEEYEALIAELDAALPILAEAAGRPTPPSMGPIFRPLFTTVLEKRPDEPEGSLIIGFRLNGNPYERADLLADTAACAALRPGATVLRFRRFVEGEVEGHECVLTGPADADDGGWTLMSDTVANGPAGRLSVRFGAAAVAESGVAVDAHRMIDLNLVELLAVGDRIAAEARGVFMGPSPVPAEATDAEVEDVREVVSDLERQFAEMGPKVGIEIVSLPEGYLNRAVAVAVPRPAAGDDRDWGASFDFEVEIERSPAATTEAPHLCRQDGRGSAIEYETLRLGGYVGHHCLFELEHDGVVGLWSRIVMENGEDRITVIQGVSLAMDGDPPERFTYLRARRAEATALFLALAANTVASKEATDGR